MDVFGGAPRFLAYPRPVVVQCGTDAVLKCQIGGDPRPAVIWERNNEQIQPEGRYRLFEDGNVYNLIISRVDAEDSGQYICKAKNSIGETYAAATLKVEGEAQQRELQEENKPRFLIKPLSTRVGRGEDAVFSCKLWGKPRPEVIWEKDGKKLNEIFESTHYSVSYQDGGWFQLKLFKTRAPDGGVYTCRARNEYGEELAGAVLLVDAGPGHEEEATRNGYANGHWKPHQGKQRGGRQLAIRQKEDPVPNSAKVKMFAVTEGKHAKFRCYVTGKPKPEIVWRKDGRLILSGRRYLLYEDREGYFTLKVLYCKQEDNGLYVCAASNTAGQTLSAVHLTVKEPPVRFKQPLSDLEVWERDLAVLECEVPEDSVPTTWYLEDRRLQPGAKYGMEEWGTMRRLTIHDVGADDDGIYLCEMADGGRSIAEVSVRGTIVRKLPRKVDVLEEENAAFCVEVEEEEMDIHWYKDGIELRETHKTIIKSFGKTHILVFVNASPEDSGVVTFLVGRSKTSSQLRVRAARHSPPSSPVGVQMNTERANAALLSWVSAHDSRKNPPSGYVLERQELSSPEWLQCLTTDSATAVEILGDSVPCEADYRFRICSVNKYGRSGHVEFPGSVHLVPVARIQTPLQDALVMEGQDAEFSIELSACVVGTWFLNGTQIQEGERFSMHRSRTHHSLCIRCAQNTDNRTEITFIAYGVRDSAALYIQAPQVKFLPLPEMDCKKTVEAGSPLVLYCELSDPTVMVHWYKDGVELHTIEGLHIQSEGTMRRLVIQSAEFTHSGVYSCDAIDDVMRFHVEVKAPPVRFRALPEAERIKSIEAGCPIALQCELSDPNAQVCWYKDGVKLLPHSDIDIQSEGNVRRLVIQSADLHHSGVYRCETDNDAIHFKMDIKAPPIITALPESERNRSTEAGCPIVLHCEVSDPTAQVCWYKDGTKLLPQSGIDIQSEGTTRRMIIQSAELAHSGVYSCDAVDDVIQYMVDVKAPPVRFTALPESERDKSTEAGCPIALHCEVSDPTAQVCWYKDGTKLLPQSGIDIQSEGTTRRMIIQSAELAHSGVYSCDAVDDVIKFTVKVKAPPVRFTALPESERYRSTEAGCPIVLHCEVSDPTAQVCWYKDGTKLLPQSDINIQSEGTTRRMIIQSAELAHSGVYSCDAVDDVIKFTVKVKAPPVRFTALPESERNKSTEAGCPIVLHCEVSDPTAQVCWYKDGTKLLPQSDIDIQSEGTTRRMIIQSAELAHSGVYSCDSVDDVMKFKVDVKAPPVRFTALPDSERSKSIEAGCPIVLHCEVSDPTAQVCWYKDGTKLLPQSSIDIQSEGTTRRMIIQSAELAHSGVYSCDAVDDVMKFKVDVKAPPVRFTALPESERNKSTEAGCPIVLHCEVSDPTAQVCWYKDGTKLLPQSGIDIQSEGTTRRMIIQSAELAHSGVYSCDAVDDVIKFMVKVKAPPVRFTALPESERNKSTEAGCPIVLHCKVSDPTAQVCWYKDGTKLLPQSDINIQSESSVRRLVIQSASLSHSGVYSCSTVDDVMKFTVDVKAPPVRFRDLDGVERNKSIEAGCPVTLYCEISDPTAQVCWYKDGSELLPQDGIDIQSEGCMRKLIIQSAEMAHSGVYSCNSIDDAIHFNVDVKAPPVRFTTLPESERDKSTEAGCPIVLHCEVSDPTAQVCWYKNGTKLLPQSGIDIQSEGTTRRMIIQSADLAHSGVYSCDAVEDVIKFKVDVEAPPVKFTALPEAEMHKSIEAGCPIVLHCELSDPTAQVSWYKDGTKLLPHSGIHIQSEGNLRRLVIQSAQFSRSGVYSCKTADDVREFYVDVKAPPVKFIEVHEEDLHKSVVESELVVLYCELSRPDVDAHWYKDGVEIKPSDNISVQSDGTMRRLIIQSTNLSDSGMYTCRAGDSALIFKVNVREPPVTIVHPREDVHLERHVSEEIVLSCELSRSNSAVHWYKDGQELQETQNIKFKSEGPYRRLVILNSSTEDTGEYVCDTADDSIFFQVTVTEPAVHIVSPSQSPLELNHRTCERLVLSCEVSRSNAIVRWYRDGLEVEENDNLILETEGVHRRLIIPKTTILDSAEYVCDAVDDSITFLVKISEPPVKFVHPQKAAGTMKGFVGEPVTLECEVSRSNAVVCWKKEGVEIEESRGISIIEDGVLRQLLIHSASLEDAGNYICDAKEDVMNFKVKINEPPVKILRKGELKMQQEFLVSDDIVLECELSRANGSVKWYKDGEKIADNDRLCMEEEGAFRSLVILNAEISDSGEYFCDARDDNVVFHVIVKEPPVSIVGNSDNPEHHSLIAGDDLVLMCEVSRPNAVVLWYCNGKLLSADYRTRIDSQGTKRQLVISDLQTSDTGKYICDATDDKMVTMVTVQEPPIKFVNKEDAKDSIEVVENESITLCAKVSLENAVVQWLKNWRDISGEHYNTSSDGKCRLFSIHHAQISDSGVYTCDAFTDEMHFTLQVKAAPVKFERKQEKAEEVFSMEGQNTVMSAVVSSGKSEVKWFRHRCQIFEAEKYEARVEGRVHSLIVKNTCKEDCGLYTCVSNDDEMVFVVSVKEMKLNFVRMLEDVCAHKDDTITLRCELCKPKGDVQWLKDGQEIIPSRRLVIKAEGRERSLTIYRATGNDSGEYVCESKDDRTCAKVMVEMPRVVEFIAEVHNVTVLEGEDAMFKCVVSPEDAELVWHRNGEPIIPDDKYIVSNNGVCHTLHILSCQLSDSCKVTAEAEGVVSKANLKVQEAQVVFTKKMEAVMAEEHGEATLEVEVSLDSGEVQWMRQGVVIQPGPKFTLRQNGKKRSLTVHNLSFSDRGTYRCETLHDRTQGKLIVESRNISIRKGLSDIETYERETASFEVELSHTDVEGVWQKDGIRLKPNNHWRVSNHGRVHSLTFSNLTLEDSGTVTFCAESVRTSARLTVKEPPVTFLKKLEDLRIPENTAALLECELSRQNVEVKWLKNGQELKPGKSYRIYSMGRKRFLQITKCGTMDSGIYTCDAGDSTVSCTLDIYEREVEIVQGLEDLDIEEDQNAVFLCEVSVEDVPGEWFKNGEKIKPTSTIKIRQEGTKHFLLMCNVRAEDSGEIKFVAKQAESTAYLEVEELPVTIVKPLRDKTALEKHRVILECTVSNPRSSIRWYQGDKLILPSEHFEICSEGCYRKLVIHQVALSDEGIYSVEVGEHKSSARLMVEEQAILIVRVLEDVEVRAPEEACFECEISVPVIKPPVWTLNGETLQHGGDVRLESMGTVHRLTLRKTTTEMTGLVKFTTGKARSSARLKVKD